MSTSNESGKVDLVEEGSEKASSYTPTIIAEGESAAVSPPALLVIKLSAQK